MNKALRFACLLIFSICLFTCIPTQAKNANVSNESHIENTYRQKDSLIDKINNLQQKQDELKSQYKDLSDIAKFNIDQYHDNIEQYHEETTSTINFYSLLITIVVTIAIGLAGILFPIWFNNKNEKQFDTKIEDLGIKIKGFQDNLKEVEELKVEIQKDRDSIIKLQKIIESDKKKAQEAAIKSQAIQYFTEALKEKDPNKQIELFNRAIKLNPDFFEAYYNRGIVKFYLNQNAAAIEDYDKAIELNPKYAGAYYNRGIAKFHLNKTEEAMQDYDKAIELDPNHAKAYCNKGEVYFKLGQYEDALQCYEKARILNPKSKAAYCNIGNANLKLGKYPEAIEDYDKALAIDPDLTEAYDNRKEAQDKLNEEGKA